MGGHLHAVSWAPAQQHMPLCACLLCMPALCMDDASVWAATDPRSLVFRIWPFKDSRWLHILGFPGCAWSGMFTRGHWVCNVTCKGQSKSSPRADAFHCCQQDENTVRRAVGEDPSFASLLSHPIAVPQTPDGEQQLTILSCAQPTVSVDMVSLQSWCCIPQSSSWMACKEG